MNNKVYQFHDFTLNTQSRRLLLNNNSLPISSKAYEILVHLIERKSEIVEKNELLEKVWKDTFVEEANLPVHISALRRILKEKKGESKFIKTIPGKGYSFVADVRENLQIEINIEKFEKSENFSEIVSTIAVLPFSFEQTSGEDYLENSITQGIINDLSTFKSLRVLSFSAVKKYKNTEIDFDEIGFLLNADKILSGYISKYKNKFSFNVELIETRDKTAIWGMEQFFDSDTIFEVKKEISEKVAEILKVKHQENEFSAKEINAEAQKLYYRGKFILESRGSSQDLRETLFTALDFFNQALSIEKNYALAYIGIGSVYVSLHNYQFIDPKISYQKAKEAALKAVKTGENLSEGYVLKGSIEFMFDKNLEESNKSFEKAVAHNPNNADGFHWKSLYNLCTGNFSKAVFYETKAIELDPLSLRFNEQLLRIFYYSGDFQKAIIQAQEILAFDKNSISSKLFLGLSYAQIGQFEIALEYVCEAIKFAKLPVLYTFKAQILALAGRKDEVKKIIEFVADKGLKNYDMALLYAVLDEKDKAFEFLHKAEAEQDSTMSILKIDSGFENLRDDERFEKILTDFGLH